MASLPQFVAFKSKANGKYLQFIGEDTVLPGRLRFTGEYVPGPYTQFQVEVSESDKDLVHIRSRYNNKYWAVSRTDLVAAMSDEQNKGTTLFRPSHVDGDSSTVRLLHVPRNKYVVMIDDVSQGDDDYACLRLGSGTEDPGSLDVYTVIDWSSLVILPRHVAFRGGEAGKFLSSRAVNDTRYLQFVADDLNDPTVGHEIFTNTDGHVSVKSDYYGKFWTRTTSSWVLADTPENGVNNNLNALFSPTKIDGMERNVVVLLNLANKNYCKSISSNDETTNEPIIALSAADGVITKLSHLQVVERVTSKHVRAEIEDVHVLDFRVVEPTLVTIVSGDAVNSGNVSKNMEVKLTYDAELLTRTWNSTVNGSLAVGEKIDIRSPIPVEENGKIIMTALTMGDIVWGEDVAKSQTPVKFTYNVTVPARTTATVRAMGRKRLWEVPFSYEQTDTLADGTKARFRMDDGIYRGTHTLFEDYKVEFAPIG